MPQIANISRAERLKEVLQGSGGFFGFSASQGKYGRLWPLLNSLFVIETDKTPSRLHVGGSITFCGHRHLCLYRIRENKPKGLIFNERATPPSFPLDKDIMLSSGANHLPTIPLQWIQYYPYPSSFSKYLGVNAAGVTRSRGAKPLLITLRTRPLACLLLIIQKRG